MTEDEARQKWCPFFRVISLPGTVADNLGAKRGGSLSGDCLASDCMAWRWNALQVVTAKEMGTGAIKDSTDTFTAECGGYCGLAGKL